MRAATAAVAARWTARPGVPALRWLCQAGAGEDSWVLDHGAGDFDAERFKNIPSPKALYQSLGVYMIDQHDARLALSVAVHNHYKRVAIREARAEQEACDLIEATSKSLDEDVQRSRAGNPHVPPPPTPPGPPGPGADSGQTPQEQAQNFLERTLDYPPYPPNAGPPTTVPEPTATPEVAEEPASLAASSTGLVPTAPAPAKKKLEEDAVFAGVPTVRLGTGALVEACEVEKSNILLLGPTGSGKTLAARALARICRVPLVICDATTLTQAGYVGDDVETIVYKLYAEAGFDVELAQRGIVYIDEVDKIARRSPGIGGYGRDVGGEGVQQALLKLLEGTVVNIPKDGPKKGQKGDTVPMDTSEILFIGAGAFSGLDSIIEHRVARASIGFGAQLKRRDDEANRAGFNDPKAPRVLLHVEPQDLGDFGLLPEFIGRFPVVTSTEALDETALVKVLTKPKNALCKQYASMMSLSNCELHFTGPALREMARQARKRGTGARGLRSIMEKLLQNAMFEVPDANATAVLIDAEAVKASAMAPPPAVYVGEEANPPAGPKLLRDQSVADYLAALKAEGVEMETEEDAEEAAPLSASG